jgi:hypothetical protein
MAQLNPTEQNRLAALQQKPVPQQTPAEVQELAALVAKQKQ